MFIFVNNLCEFIFFHLNLSLVVHFIDLTISLRPSLKSMEYSFAFKRFNDLDLASNYGHYYLTKLLFKQMKV